MRTILDQQYANAIFQEELGVFPGERAGAGRKQVEDIIGDLFGKLLVVLDAVKDVKPDRILYIRGVEIQGVVYLGAVGKGPRDLAGGVDEGNRVGAVEL